MILSSYSECPVLKSLTDSTALKNAVKVSVGDFSGGPIVKNPPLNAGDMGLILGWGTRIPRAMGQLTLHATLTTEPIQQQKILHGTAKTWCNHKECVCVFFKGQCG